jgi:hypothetical protein
LVHLQVSGIQKKASYQPTKELRVDTCAKAQVSVPGTV